ncbi:helix-turn-helix transcriptional regulator [Actinokineospora xionganensis]|uniref:AAA family ATPase n=1 Tax=Actinokineospora xionganensis TaxID=2684470 RepID=A0ABR7LFM5_9PSEU|nr:helix-turn-helix transcriptional regulator [Actinokineospora xionganensis]MBC6451442.1 AAA family ATPase [Actinokineospora xionganensis]
MPGVIGRATELTRVDAALAAAAAAGRGAVLLIAGPAGIGKTRLVDSLVTRAAERAIPVARGNCVPDEGAPALWPWWQALADRPELAARLDLDTDADPGLSVAARLRAFDSLLRELSGQARVIVLEDLHWADESTLALLRLAVGRPGLLVAATYRDDEQGPALRAAVEHLRRDASTALLTLGPWGDAEVAEFVAGQADPSWAALLRRVSGGNPLYAGELLTALTAAGLGRSPATARWPLGVPEQLRGIVAARLDSLPPAAARVARACAVIGVDSTAEEIAMLVGESPDAVRAGADDARGLLRQDGRIAFGHMLVRDAVYGCVSTSDRLRWHRKLAEAVESGALPGESVTHRLRSITDAESRSAAVRACRDAAGKALSRLAYDRAAELYDAAAGVLRVDDPDRVDLLLDAAEMWYRAGRADDAVDRCEAVASLDPAPDRLVRAALTVRGINGAVSSRLVLLCDRALSGADDVGRARVLAQRAIALADVVHHDQAEEPSREALELAERTGDPLALADALRARQQVLSGPWFVAERLELARRMLALGPKALLDGELWGRVWRIDAALQLGSMAALDDELAMLKLYADRVGLPNALWHYHRMCAVRSVLLGAFDLADEQADQALAMGRQLSDPSAEGLDIPFRAELRLLQGRAAEKLDAVSELVSLAPMPVVYAQMGRFLLDSGDPDGALALFERLRPSLPDLPRDGRWLPTVASGAVLAAHLGDADTARRCYEELLPTAQYYQAAGSGTVICVGSVSRPLGRVAAALGWRDEAIRHFENAIAMDDRIGALPFRAEAEVALAEVLVGGGRAEIARAGRIARQAAVTARRLGMPPTVARADAVLAEVRRAQHDAVPLTAREREVLTLLAVGAPNRTIADKLVLSERTVETHVSNVLAKLGVANRAQAATWAVENGHGTA